MSDHFTAKFECMKCGGTLLVLPDNATDDSIAKCKSCGQSFGRYGDIKTKVMDMAKSEVANLAKSAFAKTARKFGRR